MSQRVIACQVVGEYVTGDGVVIGAVGAHGSALIELDFTADSSGLWEGTTKTVTFTDALGANPVNVLLTADLLADGQTNVYQVPVPQAAMAVAGMMGITVTGVIVSGEIETVRVATELSQFRVLANHIQTWSGEIDVPASAAEQLQSEIDDVLDDIAHLDDSVAAAAESEANAAASATASAGSASAAAGSAANAATSESNAGTSATAAANSATAAAVSTAAAGRSATNAAGSATTAAGKATLAESWAVGGTGTRTGEDTNNAKYWSDRAQDAAGGGVSSFNGRSGVVTPQSGDYTAAQVGADQAGAAADVQANLNTHDGDTTRHITSAERTAWNGKQNALTFDNTPTENSANPVYSDGIKRYVDRMVGDVLFIATYGTTTSAEIDAAYYAGGEVVVDKDNYRYELKYRSNSTLHIFSTQTGAVRREITCNNNVWSEQVFTLANVNSPSLTGTPTAPTATAGTNTTQIATTAFVNAAVSTAIGTAIGGAY